MASRAPLLGAAALFLVGAGGLLATFPGRDAVRSFVPILRNESVSAPSPVSRVSDAAIPELSFPVELLTSAAVDEVAPTAVVEAAPSVDVEEPMTSAPEVHFAVVTAVASDSEPPAAIGALRIAMVSSGDEASAPAAATTRTDAEHSPSSEATSPVSAVSPASEERKAAQDTLAPDSKSGQAESTTSTDVHAPADSATKQESDRPKSEHESSDKGKPDSKRDSAHD